MCVVVNILLGSMTRSVLFDLELGVESRATGYVTHTHDDSFQETLTFLLLLPPEYHHLGRTSVC